jgi:formylglycine-generating enzyme required for sulfatase activity/ABC-type branched-subunit amino acid transport system substrate-binding protein
VLLHNVPSLRLVFLNACETARVSKQAGLDPFAGVAAAMVMAGIPAVVAMQFPITDEAAIRFAGRFYPLLAAGEPVDYAVGQGRLAIRVAESETLEWATPVLFMRAPDGAIFQVSEEWKAKQRLRDLPSDQDEELAQRLEQLYIDGLAAYYTGEWEKACTKLQAVVDVQPDYEQGDAHAKLQDARRQQELHGLYTQAQAARAEEDWETALAALKDLTAQKADFMDAAALLESVRRQKQLGDYYAQAQRLARAEQWRAVVSVFAKIAALDPEHPDPDGLLPIAERQVAEQKRQARLTSLYGRAVREMDAGRWAEARAILAELEEAEPGFRNAAQLLARAETEIERRQARRQQEEQVATLYQEAQTQARAGQWPQALERVKQIEALDPHFDDPEGIAAQAQGEIDRRQRLEALYSQAQSARARGEWSQAVAALQALVGEDAGYRDAATLLAEAEKQEALDGHYAQAQKQHRAGKWQAVVETFARMAEIEPDYADPEGLLPAAQRSLAEQQRRAKLDELYQRAAQAMEAGQWARARPLLAQIREMEPGYRESEQLLDRAEAEIEQAKAERERQEQIASLYEQAQSLARARQWRPALTKMDEIHALDAQFADPEGIAARAREKVAQEEAEAQRQNELAALYAEAVRLLKAEQYQEALEAWGKVQALDPRYPDRKKVQATARKKLARLAKPATKRRVPRWIGIAAGMLLVAVVVAAVIVMIHNLSTAPPTPGRIPAELGVGAVWQWSDGSAMVLVPAGDFWMGSSDPDTDPSEWPQHQVYLDAFWIDRTELTNAQYQRCVRDEGCTSPSETTSYTRESYYGDPEFDDYPVIVNWEQANAYCAWAGKRLPTEAEWEKAARGTDRRIYPWGNTFDGTLTNFCDANCPFPQRNSDWDDGYADTAPVGSYEGGASPYDAWDMAGNMHEWTTSLDKAYPYDATDGREDPEAAGQRVARGGSLGSHIVHSASRWSRSPTKSEIDLGFRCVRSASEPTQASPAPTDTKPPATQAARATEIKAPAPTQTSVPADPWSEVIVAPNGKIRIAFVGPLSGDSAEWGTAMRMAFEMALAKASSIHGFDLEAVIMDGGCDESIGKQTASELVSDPSIVGVIGHGCSMSCRSGNLLYDEAHLVTISPSCSEPDLTGYGWETFNRVAPRNDSIGWETDLANVASTGTYQQFADDFQEHYGQPIPEVLWEGGSNLAVFAAHTYDAAGILIQSIEQVAVVDASGNLVTGRQVLARAVRLTSGYEGATGVVSFDENGDRVLTATTLPGTETIPLSELASSIPWLPYDRNAVPSTLFVVFNLSKPPFNDVLVRQAFALVVDRSAVADVAETLGVAQPAPATTFTPPAVLGRDLYEQVGMAFDPSQARQLLAQAGYPNGVGFPRTTMAFNCSERYLLDKSGNQAIAQAVAAMWEEHLQIGIDLECVEVWDDYVAQLWSDAPAIFRLGWIADVMDPDNFLAWFSTGNGASWSHFSNAEFNRLVEEAAAAADDPATRQALYIKAERILCEQEAVIIPLYHYYLSLQ